MFFENMRKQMKTVMIIVVIAFAGSLLYMGGVGRSGGGTQTAVASIARVNDKEISYQSFQQAYMDTVNRQQAYGQRITGDMIEDLQYSALNALISQELLLQEADKRNVKVTKEQVDERINEIKDQFDSEEAFKSQLEAAGLSEQQLRDLLKDELKLNNLLDEVSGDVTVSEDEVKDAYFEVEASHILVKFADDTEEAKTKALEESKAIVSELTKGADFAALATERSDDEYTAEKGGNLGTIKKDSGVEEAIKDAAFALKVGEVSAPVQTDSGYHIVTVTSRKDASDTSFAEEKEDIKTQLLEEKKGKKQSEWFQQLRKDSQIVINDPQLKAYQFLMDGDMDAALVAYQEAIEENPENGYLYKSVSEIYSQKEDIDKALENMKEAATKVENDASLHYQLGKLYLEKDMKDEAVEAFKNASKYDPNNYMMHAILANEYKALGMDDLYEEENAKFQDIIKKLADQQKQAEEAQKQAEQAQDAADAENAEGTQE